jgi:PAS domain S-box-containing protein
LPITIACPSCGKTAQIVASLEGDQARCVECGQLILVPPRACVSGCTRIQAAPGGQETGELPGLPIERLPLAYIHLDADNRVREWNPAAEKIFGYRREEALGRDGLEILLPRAAQKQIQEIIRRLRAGDMDAHSVNDNRTKDGRTITCAWFNTPLRHADGAYAGIICLAQDITARQRTEARLRESEAQFQQLAANVEGYVWLNSLDDSRMYYMSPGYEKITGYSCQDLYEHPESWIDIIHPEDLPRVLAVARGPHADEPRQVEYRIVRPDGSVRWIRDRAFPVRDSAGQIYRIAGIGEDITERKEAETKVREYHERLEALSRHLLCIQEEERCHLARELHDEFGQILATALLQVYQAKGLAGGAALAQLEQCGVLLEQAGQKLRSLTLQLRPTMLDVLGLEATLRDLYERRQPWPGLAVEVVGHLSAAPLPGGTAIASFRVVQEALTNVVRHAAARHAWIELGQDEHALDVAVRDDGVGFDVAAAKQRAARSGSFGLVGMSERVLLQGGRLYIESAAGRGTCIRACFPLPAPSKRPAGTAE